MCLGSPRNKALDASESTRFTEAVRDGPDIQGAQRTHIAALSFLEEKGLVF